MFSSILWQNQEQTISLIDIPLTIAAAQGTHDHPCKDLLISSEPVQVPFASNEPKSTSARAKLDNSLSEHELTIQYESLLERACNEVREYHAGPWCLPRPYLRDTPRVRKKRKLSGDMIRSREDRANKHDEDVPADAEPPDDYLPELARRTIAVKAVHMKLEPPEVSKEAVGNICANDDGLVSNRNNSIVTMELTDIHSARYRFRVPPNSSFFLADCCDSRPFHHAIRDQAEDRCTRKHFDFIVLDPPWPNRSVKRTHKTAGSTYRTLATVSDVQDLVMSMDLDMLMADGSHIAIWITNKPAVRESVLSANGMFACWGVELIEEWVWLKSTVHGEPVTALDSTWRKPYEVLLLGRRRELGLPSLAGAITESVEVKKRVIIGVPDLHSRKPCLKALIEPLMKNPSEYRALEVFARHLVAGWWSWGDECIKFNWEGWWKKPPEEASRGQDNDPSSPS